MNAMDPLDFASLEKHWADVKASTLAELRWAKREGAAAYGRFVAATFGAIGKQRSAAHRHALKTWQPPAADIVREIPVDDPDAYLDNAPLALVLIAADWSASRKN